MSTTDMDATTAMDAVWVLPQWAEPVLLVALQPQPGTPETIYWQRPDSPPDADLTVLLCLESAEAGRSVECGWWDGEQWCLCECGGPAGQEDVRAWAEVMGPGL